MSTERDSLICMARWGRDQGKKNVIADLGPLCEMADEIDRLEADLEKHRTAAEYYGAALGMCKAKLTHAHDELAKARADIEQVIGDVKMQRTQEQVIERLRAELAKAKEAIACLEAANTEFAANRVTRTIADSDRDDPTGVNMKISIDEVMSLARRAEENDQKALSGILYAVAGSMNMGQEKELLFHVEPFCQSQLEKIRNIRQSN